MREQTTLALDVLRSQAASLPASSSGLAARVIGARDRLLAAVDAVAGLPPGVARIRVHGDYQLDQVLTAGGKLVIIDFEGEPLRPLAARRARFFALKDVAGMIRSYSYAAFAALFAVAGDDEQVAGSLDEVARWWQGAAAERFVAGYREAAGGAAFVPGDDAAFRTLLRAFVVEKATYELRYEIGHRPRWLRIPLRGLTALLDES
jgi:maltose alpha-D-glucosyltransferase/alpha-amylase